MVAILGNVTTLIIIFALLAYGGWKTLLLATIATFLFHWWYRDRHGHWMGD